MTAKRFSERIAAASRCGRRGLLFSASLLLALPGCGGDKGPVLVEAGGTVTYNGEPVPDATIVFAPEGSGLPANARTDEKGQFTVMTKGAAGAAVDSYKVAITAIRLKGPVSVNMTTQQILANEEVLIPRKYGNLKTSGLKATVSEDPAQNQFEFKLP